LLLENGQVLEPDPKCIVPVQHQAALSHATHTTKTVVQHNVLMKVVYKFFLSYMDIWTVLMTRFFSPQPDISLYAARPLI